jgi:type IV pilus assembly protein PilB
VAHGPEKLGEILVTSGLVSEEQLAKALDDQTRDGGRLGEALVRNLVVTEEQIAAALAAQKGLSHVSLASYPVDAFAASLLPERVARRRVMLPIGFSGDDILLAMSNPLDIEAIDDVEMRTKRKVIPVVAAPTQIRYAIEKYVVGAEAFRDEVETIDFGDLEPDEGIADIDTMPVVRTVNRILRDAVREGASDIHIEPAEKEVRVRYRIDGVLRDAKDLPRKAAAGVLSRVKVMADMDIAERRLPQDGRIGLRVDDRTVDLRVASLPTRYGESLVIRILNSSLSFLDLEDLGMSEVTLRRFLRLLAHPYGSILVAGPTGSGKSTTLYAALNRINDSTRKIITVEDPVEYVMRGTTQIAINPRIGLTFAAGLRTILRSDPDVVMVGEIRDPETAEISVRAALTGHLVLSSIHTNDAPSGLTRLSEMGVPEYVTSSSLLGVVAQRLVRRLCDSCKQPTTCSWDELVAAGFEDDEAVGMSVYEPLGCSECRNTGYKGRIGVFEVMTVDDQITRAFLRNAPSEEVRRIALEGGMVPMKRDALDKVAIGLTSLDEIARTVV